jgi:hypothetical protein
VFAWLISHQYFSLRTNQPTPISQQYFSLRTNQHQPPVTSQTNRLDVVRESAEVWFDLAVEYWNQVITLTPENYIEACEEYIVNGVQIWGTNQPLFKCADLHCKCTFHPFTFTLSHIFSQRSAHPFTILCSAKTFFLLLQRHYLSAQFAHLNSPGPWYKSEKNRGSEQRHESLARVDQLMAWGQAASSWGKRESQARVLRTTSGSVASNSMMEKIKDAV